jgi:glyoxylase-like metal-dependent hydrolase (beta-lactamase superfamily II)
VPDVTHAALRIGRVEVSVVCEGFAPLELSDEMPGVEVDWTAERAAFPWAFHGEDAWAWHVHAFVLRTPDGVAMIDAGLGDYPPFRPWAESTDRDVALATAGVDPDDVRHVVHTHLHADHAGGAVVEERPRFRNAVHHVHPADWSFFARPDRVGGFTARGPMSELERLGMIDLREGDHEVAEGIRVVHAPGHTPGHRVAVLESDGQTLALTGDLLHVPIQVARPDSPSNHDVDAAEACRSRSAILRRAREGGWHVAVSHFARPFGRVQAAGWRADP